MKGKEKLEILEKDDEYVFHGSYMKIEEFEPRQAYTIVDGTKIPDGEPAVFASPFMDYAIFMAIINRINCPKGSRSGCSYNEKGLSFTATQKTLDQLSESSRGYVHVFNRSDFLQRNGSEWVSYKKVKPIEIIEVEWSDFTPSITVIGDDSSNIVH